MGKVTRVVVMLPNVRTSVVKLDPLVVQGYSTLQEVNKHRRLKNVGTLGCFLECRTKGNKIRYWAVTSGHLFIERGFCKYQETDIVVVQPPSVCLQILTDCYFASVKEIGQNPEFLDAAVFQVDSRKLPHLHPLVNYHIPEACSSAELLDRQVWKTGKGFSLATEW